MQRKNLAEISKMLNQISVGKLFADDNVYLKPLNEYVGYAGLRFAKYFKNGKHCTLADMCYYLRSMCFRAIF